MKLNIIKEFLDDYSKGHYGRELAKKLPMSQKAIAMHLKGLEKEGILKARKTGNIKFYFLNQHYTEIKDIIIHAEIAKKLMFFAKHRKLANLFKDDERIVGIFGSYVRGTQNKDSDIDIFVIGRKKEKDYEEIGKSIGLPISQHIFSDKEFRNLIQDKIPLIKDIIKDHVLITGVERFVHFVWREYYGLN